MHAHLSQGNEVQLDLGEVEGQRVEPEGRGDERGGDEPGSPRHAGVIA